jgi:hypothetical protein
MTVQGVSTALGAGARLQYLLLVDRKVAGDVPDAAAGFTGNLETLHKTPKIGNPHISVRIVAWVAEMRDIRRPCKPPHPPFDPESGWGEGTGTGLTISIGTCGREL